MKCNLALIILRECILSSAGEEGGQFHLAWFKNLHKIPNNTFYRHVNTLIDEGFLVRDSRNTYRLHPLFVSRVSDSDMKLHEGGTKWSVVPF